MLHLHDITKNIKVFPVFSKVLCSQGDGVKTFCVHTKRSTDQASNWQLRQSANQRIDTANPVC